MDSQIARRVAAIGNVVGPDQAAASRDIFAPLWAARSGMVGVTMNYRLAPEHRWPSGAQDVGAAVAWLTAFRRL
jgi:acetyl esterase/lipase